MDAVTYQSYLQTSGKIAALASLLFAGVALLVAEYTWSSLIQLAAIPVAYAMPPPASHLCVACAAACASVELVLFVFCIAAGHPLHIGTDVQCGALALISVGLVADAAVHDRALLKSKRTGDQSPRHLEKMQPPPFEVGPEYVLF